jgi:hypothetical protein
MIKNNKMHGIGTIMLFLFLLSIPVTALGEVNISGVVGSTTTDPSALYGSYYLRYVGDPPPPNYDPDHNYQWGAPQILCQPEIAPVTFMGAIDVGQMPVGSVGFIGLLDAGLLESGASDYQSGAYVYIYKTAVDLRIGPTDGNLGGEIVQTFLTIPNANIPAGGILSITLTIDGTADPTTCANGSSGLSATGCIYLDVNGYAQIQDSYGEVKTLNNANAYAWTEFQFGAHPGWDDYGNSNIAYFFALTGCTPVYKNLGDCISTLTDQNCSLLLGKDRAECNHSQINYCQELFGVPPGQN